MIDPRSIDEQMRKHFEAVWNAGDSWEFETSEFERSRFERQFELLNDRRYARVLEIGCGAGAFTEWLTAFANQLVAIDISDTALERARVQFQNVGNDVEFRSINVMEFQVKEAGPWDLIVFSETIYCLGWLYPFFDVAFLVAELFESQNDGGRLLLANTYGHNHDWLLRPWLIDTYRDLFRNVGYHVEREEIFCGTKHDVEMKVLMTLFRKP